jgi:hypothetical protein
MDDTEFLAHATEIVNDLETELRRVKPEQRGHWRALEIGCGSGLLMRPMSRHFLEIHGVDPSPVRIEQAHRHLSDIPNARLPEADGDGLPLTVPAAENGRFDFLYSLEAGFDALPWLGHALREGGLARLRFNGLERSRHDLLEFAASHDLQVLAIQGSGTRSMWVTFRKQPSGWSGRTNRPPSAAVIIRKITNASSNEPVAPSRGRFASISIVVEQLPEDAGLNHLRVTIGDSFGTVASVSPLDRTDLQCIRVDLPELEETGLLPVRLFWLEEPISTPHMLRVIPPGPAVPRILSVGRGAGMRTVRILVEDIARPHEMQVSMGGMPVVDLNYACVDPKPQRFDVTFHLPDEIGPGLHHVSLTLGRRKLAPVPFRVH